MPGVGQLVRVDAQLGVGVCGERVMRGQLLGQFPRRPHARALGHIDRGQLVQFLLGEILEFGLLLGQQGGSVSRWLLTDTYSPNAIDTAPATNPAIPAVRIGPGSGVTAATPTTRPAVDTMPSFAPNTPARSQFSRRPIPSACGSAACKPGESAPAPAPLALAHPAPTLSVLFVTARSIAGPADA
jgi:hypothetical protein